VGRPVTTGESPSIRRTPKETGLRLNRFLAAAGLGSRRSCEELILKGSVSINGSVCRDLATRVLSEDDVRLSGRVIHAFAPRTIILNKPAGYTCTRSDKHAERTIFDLLPSDTGHLFHVGRLDKDSEGLLLLTNDGILAQDLMHPSKGVDKEYEVILDKTFTDKDAASLRRGTWIKGSVARIESVRNLAPNKIQIILHQGIKRQIRVMLGQLGFNVKRLTRVRLGPLTLRGIKPGSYRDLRKEDLEILQKALKAPKLKKEKPAFLRKPRAKTLNAIKGPLFTAMPPSSKASKSTRSPNSAKSLTAPRSERSCATRPDSKDRPHAKRPRKASPTLRRVKKVNG
jgi:23S rRNA pseudouridine2605 synthase